MREPARSGGRAPSVPRGASRARGSVTPAIAAIASIAASIAACGSPSGPPARSSPSVVVPASAGSDASEVARAHALDPADADAPPIAPAAAPGPIGDDPRPASAAPEAARADGDERPAAAASDGWRTLFDGRGLGGFTPSSFPGGGEVRVEDGLLVLEPGAPLTGVTWGGAAPVGDYEIEVEAARLRGDDFFCALTLPVGGSSATVVLGGWGGALTGLSCIDGADASANETRSFVAYERGRFHRLRVRVVGARVAAWLDDATLFDVDTAGRTVELRPEVLPSSPLGVASYATRSAIRDIRLRPLGAPDERDP